MNYKLNTLIILCVIISLSAVLPKSYSQDSDCISNPNDWDGDGIPNDWENRGIDINSDGIIDYGLASFNVSPLHKDLFLEIDYMKNHGIFEGVLEKIQQAFKDSDVCNPDHTPGIKLHIQYDQEIPHQPVIQTYSFVGSDYLRTWKGFDDLKKKYFGTNQEKDDNPNVNNTLLAKSKIFHYVIFAHAIDNIDNSVSGLSRGIPGIDFIVSIGNLKSGGAKVIGHYNGMDNHQAGTLMHEFGHNLGLGHGGGDAINCKPNYLSIMNYLRQMPVILPPAYYKLDYSRMELSPLNESSLDELKGVTASIPIDVPDPLIIGNAFNFNFVKHAIDWDYNGRFEARIPQDINLFSKIDACAKNTPGQFLEGYDDWDNLIFIPNESGLGPRENGTLSVHSIENDTMGEKELAYEDIMVLQVSSLESIRNTTITLAPNTTLGDELNREIIGRIETSLGSISNTTNMLSPESITVKDFYNESILGDSISIEANTSSNHNNLPNSSSLFSGSLLPSSSIFSGAIIPVSSNHNNLPNSSSLFSVGLSQDTTKGNLISLFDEPFKENTVSSLNSSLYMDKIESNSYEINYNKTITNLESLKTTLDSSLGGLAEDDLITDPVDQRNLYSGIDNVIEVLKANSCSGDNCVVLEKNPNETLLFSAD